MSIEQDKLKLLWYGVGAVAAIAALIAVFYVLTGKSVSIDKSDSGGGGYQAGGEVRNCIKSVLGNPPSCSDNDGKLKKTTLNGKSLGLCSAIDAKNNCIT